MARLGRSLVDEAVTGLVAPEQPVPGGADRESLVDRDDRGVARTAPRLDVERDRPGAGVGRTLRSVVRVVEHVAQEAHVLRAAPPDDDLRAARIHRASAGRSTNATSVWRNVAPSAPSVAR